MNATEIAIEALVSRLGRIAEKNSDQFDCGIFIRDRNKTLVFTFIARENAENHELVSGCGKSILEAVRDAESNLSEACVAWNYDLVD